MKRESGRFGIDVLRCCRAHGELCAAGSGKRAATGPAGGPTKDRDGP